MGSRIGRKNASETYPTSRGLGVGPSGGPNDSLILVPDIATLSALPVGSLVNGTWGKPLTIDQPYELSPLDSLSIDGIQVLGSPDGTRVWVRIELPAPTWQKQLIWWVDTAAGNDESDGSTFVLPLPGSHVGPLQTVAEACRRLHLAQAGRNYVINVKGDVPSTDRFRASFLTTTNVEDLLPAVIGSPPPAATGTEQVFNMTLNGIRTLSPLTGSISAFTPTSPAAGVQATFVDIAPQFSLGEIIELTVVGGGIGVGSIAAVGASPATDASLAPNTFRCTDFNFPNEIINGAPNANGNNTILTAPLSATLPFTYAKQILPKWNGSIIQIGVSQGRYQINGFEFPAPLPPPADQQNLTLRNVSFTFRGCIFNRPIQPSFGCASTFSACSFAYPSSGGGGVGGTTIVNSIGGAYTFLNSLMLNTDFRLLSGVTFAQLNNLYIEGGLFQTKTLGTVGDYGFTLAVSATKGTRGCMIAGLGLGVYNWPNAHDRAGIVLSDSASVRIGGGANIFGTSLAASSLGVTGCLVEGASELLVGELGTTTISAASNAAVLPQPIINVASTSGLPSSGTLVITLGLGGTALVTYTGTTPTSFTGCAGGAGVLQTGDIVEVITIPKIAGSTNDILIDNPGSKSAPVACYVTTPLAAGAIAITAAALNKWNSGATSWTDTSTFNRYAFNPATGSRVVSVPAP